MWPWQAWPTLAATARTTPKTSAGCWIDTKDEKAPKAGGKGVTSNTDYLIVGDSLEGVNSPRKGIAGYNAAFDRIATDMKNKAVSDGVTVITLRRYLDMIGYRAPKVTSSGLR